MKRISKNTIRKLLWPREADAHKGSHGHALLVAGSSGKTGAAVIAGMACLRSGAGLTTVCIPAEERSILQVAIPEAMVAFREEPLEWKKFSAIGIGPGIGTYATAKEMVGNILADCNSPLLFDADAITILGSDKKLFDSLPAGTVLTPHPKEFDRLFGDHSNEEERRITAIKYAAENNLVIVLKGQHSLVTSAKGTYLNGTGNAGLAKGGSGDALTGMITSFLAQGYEPHTAAMIGVYLHGLAADIALKDQSMESMLITDVIGSLGKAFKEVQRRK